MAGRRLGGAVFVGAAFVEAMVVGSIFVGKEFPESVFATDEAPDVALADTFDMLR